MFDDLLAGIVIADFVFPETNGTDIWFAGYGITDTTAYPQDADGVRLFERDGRLHYHPVGVAGHGLRLLGNHRTTGEGPWLALARSHADRLIEQADSLDGALYFPYTYEQILHGNEEDRLTAPWYSGMAQGLAISLFARLHEVTGDPGYLEAADAVLPTFFRRRGDHEVFTVEVADDGYYWIEEYPTETPSRVLNGFVYAVCGLHDYWRVSGDDLAGRFVAASVTTLMRHVEEYRVPGAPSYYCLGHRVQLPAYHDIHLLQMDYLEAMTGLAFFGVVHDSLSSDAG